MFAGQPPAVVQSGHADDSLIEVVGQRPDQALKIDRRTYRVRENPQSEAADGHQLLRGLPAVTIGPDDQLMLLGNANVTLLVDERPIQGDPAQYLRTIHGGDIERIEIITNPSAQFPSVGTGGIVNIVLKQKRADGLTGSANAQLSSLGQILGGVTLKYKTGPWTLDTTVEGNDGPWAGWRYRKYREASTASGDSPTIDVETGRGSTLGRYGGATARLGYALDPRTQIAGEIFIGRYAPGSDNRARFEGLTADFASFSTRERNRSPGGYQGGQILFDRKGKTEGELLKGSIMVYGTANRIDTAVSGGPGGGFSSQQRRSGPRAFVQLDWTHPIGATRILSLGGLYSHAADVRRYRFAAGDGGSGPGVAERFDPMVDSLSAYATYQQRFGSWTLMPGLRLERISRDLSSPGAAALRRARTNLFPTLHVDHPLAKGLDLSLSYSKRIDRADVESLRPYAIVTATQTVSLGNPALRDQTTDAFEANLHYHRGKLDLGLIVYDRETGALWGSASEVNGAGMSVISTRNIGRESDRGAQIDLATPLIRRVKASASVNLFDSRIPVAFGGGRSMDEVFHYTGNATISWDGPRRGDRAGDGAQIQLTYDSPSRLYQTRWAGRFGLNLSYTRSLFRNFAVTASLENIGQGDLRQWLDAPLVQERLSRHLTQPVAKLKLVKTFGGAH